MNSLQEREKQGSLASPGAPLAGLPLTLQNNAAFSAGLITSISGQTAPFDEADIMGNFDGHEDLTADHAARLFDNAPNNWMLTWAAISEHTIANGFTENIYYFGDSVGNVIVGADTNTDSRVDSSVIINLLTSMNAFGSLQSGDQIVDVGVDGVSQGDIGSYTFVNVTANQTISATFALTERQLYLPLVGR
jgi:hypothetical protein